ncbi:MAG: hypothetical protein RR314_04435 [Oscillospiraceae bacterium]
MKFDCKKTEDCFADSCTYEYALPISAAELASRLEGWEKRENTRLRRPVFVADRDGVNLKGVLAAHTVRASFPNSRRESEKFAFEAWLEEQNV